MIYSLKSLKGAHLIAEDEAFGACRDVFFHDRSRAVVYFVADTDRWTRGIKSLISPEAVERINESELRLNLSRKQVEDSPSVDEDQPVSRQVEEKLYTHYGWTPYWKRSDMEDPNIPVPPIGADANDQDMESEQTFSGNPHLRSLNEVLDYRALSFGDNIGSIIDLLVNEENWQIEYLVVDNKPWQAGKRHVVPAQYIQAIKFDSHTVNLTLPANEIEQCADYDQLSFPLDDEARQAVDRINDLAQR